MNKPSRRFPSPVRGTTSPDGYVLPPSGAFMEGMREMPMFHKKPVVIEARQFDGLNENDILDWIDDGNAYFIPSGQFTGAALIIPTLEGDHRADVGDWIIRGVKGEHYPCKPDIFTATYDPVTP